MIGTGTQNMIFAWIKELFLCTTVINNYVYMDTKLNLLFKNLKILLEFLDVNPNVLRRNNFGTWMILLIFCLKFLPTSLAPRPSLPKMVRAVIGSDMPPPSLPSPPPTTKKNESKLLLALICRHHLYPASTYQKVSQSCDWLRVWDATSALTQP